ncbi:MAG: LysR family transcriptional regulator [Verrucomicrobiales bacterium]|nr:LysR family transcriptional regulator [Verrucomicrobiales bacterium]
MELRHLRYFVAVAEEENVTRAAARLHVSQPPLTRQIHDLEEELGVALFERNGKSIRLTEAGRVFLREARASLQRVEEAVAAVRVAAREQHGELRLGYAPSPSVEILPLLLSAFQRQCPNVRVTLHDHSSPEMLAGLREGQLHAALMMQPSRPAAQGVTFAPLRTYPVGILVPPTHPLARRRAVTVDDAFTEPLVVFSRKEYPDYHEFVARVAGKRLKHLRFAEECDSGPSLMAAIASGKGIAISASVVASAAGARLQFVPLTPAPPPAVVGLACRRVAPLSPSQSLLEVAKTLADQAS